MNITEWKKYQNIVVTCYQNPDLDGYASAYAYAELLRHLGLNANAAISGTPSIETEYIIKKTKTEDVANAKRLLETADAVILVDASDTTGIDKKIKPSKVIQIIDHRMHNEAEVFKNAQIEIEIVGATATMIAEKFIERGVRLYENTGILLYTAIVSNTVNFKNRVTTHRDRRTSEWLKTQVEIPHDLIEKMFKAKSIFKDESLYHVIEANLALYKFKRALTGIAQLEIVEALKFIEKNQEDLLKNLRKLANKYETKYFALSIIDVNEGHNLFLAEDEDSQDLLQKTLNLEFNDGIAFTDGLIMRKELVPIIHAHIEGHVFDINDIRPKDFNFFSRHHHDDDEALPGEEEISM